MYKCQDLKTFNPSEYTSVKNLEPKDISQNRRVDRKFAFQRSQRFWISSSFHGFETAYESVNKQ